MSFLSNLFGHVAGPIVGGLFGSHNSRNNAKKEAELQRENWIYQQSNAHQLEVEDLKKAGLNPILSAGGSSNMASVGMPSASDSVGPAIIQAISNAHQVSEQNKVELEKAKIQAQSEKYKADKDYEANQDTIASNVELKDSETKKNLSDITVNDAKVGVMQSERNLNEKQAEKIASDIENAAKITVATLDLLGSQAQMNRSMASQAYANMNKIYEDLRHNKVTYRFLEDQYPGQIEQFEQEMRKMRREWDISNGFEKDYGKENMDRLRKFGTIVTNIAGFVGDIGNAVVKGRAAFGNDKPYVRVDSGDGVGSYRK